MNNLERFNAFIKNEIAPVLKKNSFKKSGLTWNKKVNDFIQVINIQKSKYCDSELVDFTLNMGIFSETVFEIIWDKAASKVSKEQDCLLRSRIGPVLQNDFTGSANDQWWSVGNDTDVDDLASYFINNLENIVIPFLDKFININNIYNFINNEKGCLVDTPLCRLYFAVIAYQMGKISEAKMIISHIIDKHEPWKERCLITAKNLGITNVEGVLGKNSSKR